MSGGASLIRVEVVFAESGRAVAATFQLPAPATVADVLALAARRVEFAGLAGLHSAVGIFGRRAAAGDVVVDGDRVEIYRPLTADPKNARRARARASVKSQRRGPDIAG